MDITSIRAAYRRYAKVYDLTFGSVFAEGRRRTVEQVNRVGGQRVLEVGVGTGLSLPLHRRDNRVVGIDLSRDMLAIARQRAAHERLGHVEALLEMDAERLAFADSTFDAVVAMYVMTVVPDAQRAIEELKRVCRPGGDIFIINHFASERLGLRRTVEQSLARFSPALGWQPDFTLESLLSTANVEVAAIRTMPPFGLFSLLECRNA